MVKSRSSGRRIFCWLTLQERNRIGSLACLVKKLFPDRGMLKLDEVEYTKRYEAILSRLAPMQVYRELDTMMRNYGASAVALVCWEKPEKFCHRHLVAKWFKEKLGMDVMEYDYKPKKELSVTQFNLFD